MAASSRSTANVGRAGRASLAGLAAHAASRWTHSKRAVLDLTSARERAARYLKGLRERSPHLRDLVILDEATREYEFGWLFFYETATRAPGPMGRFVVARDTMIEIGHATTAEQIERVRALFLEYQASLDVDLCFQGFADEVARLPGSYALPLGRLLLCTVNQVPRGCVALQAITSEDCEMKRLYVQPGQRGLGLGRSLVDRVLTEARVIGYRRIYLDTLPSMARAAAMYEARGFKDVAPYRHNPVVGTRYMALDL